MEPIKWIETLEKYIPFIFKKINKKRIELRNILEEDPKFNNLKKDEIKQYVIFGRKCLLKEQLFLKKAVNYLQQFDNLERKSMMQKILCKNKNCRATELKEKIAKRSKEITDIKDSIEKNPQF